jgi:undecaprenyl-diphosphatase
MSYVQLLLLALIQGAAELLPVSSSAHVILAAKLMKLKTSTPDFVFRLVMLHTGTMFAVLFYFWPRWRWLLLGANPSQPAALSRVRFLAMILLATFCTGVLGLGLKFFIEKIVLIGMLHHEKGEVEELFESLPLIAAALFTVGILIIVAGVVARGQERGNVRTLSSQTSIMVGLIQGLCLPFRGFSRSGATISTALLCGTERNLAEEFSFALAVVLTPPVIVRSLYRLWRDQTSLTAQLADSLLPGLVGMVFSFLAGLVALKLLSTVLEKGRWQYFGYYCILASLAVLYAWRQGY